MMNETRIILVGDQAGLDTHVMGIEKHNFSGSKVCSVVILIRSAPWIESAEQVLGDIPNNACACIMVNYCFW